MLLLLSILFVSVFVPLRETLAGEKTIKLTAISKSDKKKIAHWAYAYYRKNTANIALVIPKVKKYLPIIEEAAKEFGYDKEIAIGVAAAESGFKHGKVAKGGDTGLFQIKSIPEEVTVLVGDVLGHTPDKHDVIDNIYLGVATLAYYRYFMGDDLLLGLVAYNMGSGGDLAFILRKYGATSFPEVQPYLKDSKKQSPRMYPIKVLSFALGYRVWQKFGKFPSYEKKNNARKIQALGIPGFGKKAIITAEDEAGRAFYVVDRGDTIYDLAKIFVVNIEELYKYNPQIEGRVIRVNQKIYLPPEFTWHRVKPGESLVSIRKQYDIPAGFIKVWNKKIRDTIQPGEVLIVRIEK